MEGTSVLSEFSFSTDPTFDLQDEALPEAEISAGERDVFPAQDLIEDDEEEDVEAAKAWKSLPLSPTTSTSWSRSATSG